MAFLRRLFGGPAADVPQQPDPRHQVAVLVPLSDPELKNEREQLAVYALEDRLMRALDESGAGTHDGNELERGFLRIQLRGPDADAMVAAIRPLLGEAPAGTYLAIRRGAEGTSEERLDP